MLPYINIGSNEIQLYPIVAGLVYVLTVFAGWGYSYCCRIKPWKGVILSFSVMLLSIPVMFVLSWVDTGFKGIGTINGLRVWLYSGFLSMPIAKLLKVDYKRHLDFSCVVVLFGQGIGKAPCIFEGCCHGFPYDGPGAMYHYNVNDYLFPVQICEAVTLLGILVFIIVISAVKKFRIYGNRYPIAMFFYGSTRVLWEFFRDNKKLFYIGEYGVSNLALHALYITVFSAVWFFFTTPRGIYCAKTMGNGIRKIFKKGMKEIPTIEEIKARLKKEADDSLLITC